MEWLAPWEPVGPERGDAALCQGWEAELERELAPGHALHGMRVGLIGRRFDCDGALYRLDDGRVASVHVTWKGSRETDVRWPATEVCASLGDWAERCMARDHDEWSCGQGGDSPS